MIPSQQRRPLITKTIAFTVYTEKTNGKYNVSMDVQVFGNTRKEALSNPRSLLISVEEVSDGDKDEQYISAICIKKIHSVLRVGMNVETSYGVASVCITNADN